MCALLLNFYHKKQENYAAISKRFSVDDPCNGIALCKNHHWAMDHFLLVPGKDKLWHVSPELDDRIAGCKDIISLNNRKVLLPQNEKFHPKEEFLAWRHERILK